MANRNCLRVAHVCHSKNFGRLIYRCQKSEQEDAISCEKRIKNKARINPTEHFLRCETHNEFVNSGIARALTLIISFGNWLANLSRFDCCQHVRVPPALISQNESMTTSQVAQLVEPAAFSPMSLFALHTTSTTSMCAVPPSPS